MKHIFNIVSFLITPLIAPFLFMTFTGVAVHAKEEDASDEILIYLEHTPPGALRIGQRAIIEGSMEGANEVEIVHLYFRSSATAKWQRLEMDQVRGVNYRAIIPAKSVQPPSLEYYVVAIDFLGEAHAALGSKASPATIVIGFIDKKMAEESTVKREDTNIPPSSEEKTAAIEAAIMPAMALTAIDDSGLADHFASAAGSILITREQIQKMGARTLVDILSSVPEFYVAQTESGYYRVSTGPWERHGTVLLSLNEQIVSDPYDGRAFWAIPAEVISDVVISLPGQMAIDKEPGIALVEVTTNHSSKTSMNVSIGETWSHTSDPGASHWGAYRGSASTGIETARIKANGYASANLADGAQARFSADSYNGDNYTSSAAPGPVKGQNSRFLIGGSAKLREFMPGDFDFDFNFFYENRDGYIGKTAAYSPDSNVSRNRIAVQAKHSYAITSRFELTSKLQFANYGHSSSFRLTPPDYVLSDRDGDGVDEFFTDGVSEQFFSSSNILATSFSADLEPARGHLVKTGFRYSYLSASEPRIERNISPEGVAFNRDYTIDNPTLLISSLSRSLATFFIQENWAFSSMLHLSAGLRASWLSDLPSYEASKLLSPRLSVTYGSESTWKAALAYSSDFTPPTLSERTDRTSQTLPQSLQTGQMVGNPQLLTGAAHNLTGRFSHNTTYEKTKYKTNIFLFYQRGHDMPVAVATTSQGNEYSSSASTDTLGFSADGQATFSSRNHLRAALYMMRATNHGDIRNTLLTATPQLGALLGLDLALGPWANTHIQANYIAERRNNERTVFETLNSYTLPASLNVNAYIFTQPMFTHWRFGLSIHNLLDEAHYDAPQRPDLLPGMVPRDGRTFMLNAELLP